jgi:signal transduction histidine kinase
VNPSSDARDYNLRLLWTLARYLEDTHGAESLARVAAAGRLETTDFDAKEFWVSAEVFEAVLAEARAGLADDEEFKRACVYRLAESDAPLMHVLWDASPAAVFRRAAEHYGLLCRCGTMTLVGHSETSAHVRVTSRVRCSRLTCLLRQSRSVVLPTLWGLPPAASREHLCLARGDDCCEVEYRWYAPRRRLPALLGAAAGALLGCVLVGLGVAGILTPIALTAAGGLLGHALETRRSERLNEATRREIMKALRSLALEENEARRELLGVSHDLRSPLAVILANAEYLRSVPAVLADPKAAQIAEDIHESASRMRRLLGEVVEVTAAQRSLANMAPQRVETRDLAESLRRRLRALVYERDVRTTVVATAAAPEHIDIDPLALDRIVDNLMTNAAKYTDRGSIDVELDGAGRQLVIKISDTGQGIDPDQMARVLQPGGSSIESRRGDGSGVGLSLVVQLVEQLGGRMELASRPGAGTTFRVYLPLKSARPEPTATMDERPLATRGSK